MNRSLAIRSAASVVLMTSWAVASAHTGTPDVEALLAKMRGAYRSVKTAHFTVESAMGGRHYRVDWVYSSPIRSKVEISVAVGSTTGSDRTILIDGKTMWETIRGYGKVNHAPFALNLFERSMPVNLESLCFFDWDRQLSTASGKNMAHSTLEIQPNRPWNGKKWLVLEERAPDPATGGGIICHYYIDPKTHLIWRTTQRPIGSSIQTVDAQIKRLDLNPILPPTTFKPLVPPLPNKGPLIRA